MSELLITSLAPEDVAVSFWVWFDPLLEDHFSLPISDVEADNLLRQLAPEGIVPVQVYADGMTAAIEKAFPYRKGRSKVSLRKH